MKPELHDIVEFHSSEQLDESRQRIVKFCVIVEKYYYSLT